MRSILIIDDDPLIRKTLSSHLSRDDYEIVLAEDGEDGLEVYEEKRPDLVVLDIRLPDIDGLETLRRIREKDENASVIIYSSRGR